MSYPSDETIRMLRNVRDYAYTIWTRAQWAKADIEVIQQRPDWETAAEAELTEALKHTIEAMNAIKSALNRLKSLPVEPRPEV